jgi:type IV secretory pathway TrbF-like protein
MGKNVNDLNEGATASPRTVYLAARQEWLERYGDYIAQARNWRMVALLALIVAGIALTSLMMLARQSRVVPYVVKVDRLGEAVAVERADAAAQPDEAIIKAQLARWLTAVRSVYVDAAAQRTLITEAYAMINRLGSAYGALNEYMRAHDPFERAKTETVAVQVESVLPIAGTSWRVEWREEVRGRDGSRIASSQHQASVSMSFNPPTDEATLRLNPTGLYINSFHWAKRL